MAYQVSGPVNGNETDAGETGTASMIRAIIQISRLVGLSVLDTVDCLEGKKRDERLGSRVRHADARRHVRATLPVAP